MLVLAVGAMSGVRTYRLLFLGRCKLLSTVWLNTHGYTDMSNSSSHSDWLTAAEIMKRWVHFRSKLCFVFGIQCRERYMYRVWNLLDVFTFICWRCRVSNISKMFMSFFICWIFYSILCAHWNSNFHGWACKHHLRNLESPTYGYWLLMDF